MKKQNLDYASIKRIQKVASLVSGKSVLDIGCRDGFLRRFLPKGTKYFGLEVGKKKGKDKKAGFKITLLPKGILDPGISKAFKNKRFDTIILSETLEHLPEPLLALKNCHSLLKKGGQLVGSVPNGLGWRYFFFLEIVRDGMKDFARPVWDGSEHFYTFNKFVLRTLFMYAGFKVKLIKEWGIWLPRTRFFLPINFRGSHLIFVVEK
jgi:SAM-dependent methyltransferase